MEYPYEDDLGFVWVDSNTFLGDKNGECFMCRQPTKRLDINYHGYFCGSDACEQAVRDDLRRLNGEV